MRKLRSDYYTSKIAEHEGNPKATWRILKRVINRDTKSGDIKRIFYNGEQVDNKALISETFKVHITPLTKFCSETPYGVKTLHAKYFQNRNCGFPII